MEEDKKKINMKTGEHASQNLLGSKPEAVVNDGASTSNPNKKKAEDAKAPILPTEKEEDPTPHRSSPEPSCSICLEQLNNKSFTNSCSHMFCFNCLVKWSKKKPECPLCKQSFTSIVHNLRSYQEFDLYHINRESRSERSNSYNTTNNTSNESVRIVDSIETASHRIRFSPLSLHSSLFSRQEIKRSRPCIFRRRVYEEDLWVKPQIGNIVHSVLPEFFRQYSDRSLRLLPWLNRELNVIMSNNESQISLVIELIMDLIKKVKITSQEFFIQIEPYTAAFTTHFIHELHNFAISPYHIDSYDFRADYRTDRNRELQNEIASHRMRFAPHTVDSRAFFTQTLPSHIPCSFRRKIYEENVWVRPQIGIHVRSASPEFYRKNIACTHRLLPWLKRELLVVMPNNEGQVSFVIELIMSLIIKYNITSQEFFTPIEPYTAPYTSHFIHEFYNFAVFPYDMEVYDFEAEYATLPHEVCLLSSLDCDVVPLPTSSEPSSKSTTSESKSKQKHHSTKKRYMSEFKDQLAKSVKRNSANNCRETATNSLPLLNFYGVSSSANTFEIAGPSTSRNSLFPSSTTETSSQTISKFECAQDDECQIVEVVKSKSGNGKITTIVDLSSEDEAVLRPLVIPYSNTCSIEKKVSLSINGSLPVTGKIDVSSDQASSDGEDDVIFLSQMQTLPNMSYSVKPIDYSLKPADKTIEIESKEEEPATTSDKDNIKHI